MTTDIAPNYGTSAPRADSSVRSTLTLSDLDVLPQKELDDLFRGLLRPGNERRAGEVPDGDSLGVAIVGRGTFWRRWFAGFVRRHLWQGKVFHRESADHGTLVNKVSALGVPSIKARVYRDKSRFDGQECIVLDYSRTSFIARRIRDEIREIRPGLYLGLVYWGRSNKRLLDFALDFNRQPGMH